MNRLHMSRGQPLVALAIILSGWVGVRVMLIDFPLNAAGFDKPVESTPSQSPQSKRSKGNAASAAPDARFVWPVDRASEQAEEAPALLPQSPDRLQFADDLHPPMPERPAQTIAPVPHWQQTGPRPRSGATRPSPVATAVGHHALWMAALSRMPFPDDLSSAAPGPRLAAVPFAPPSRGAGVDRRWSGDAWLLLRRGSSANFAGGASTATYGASQVGGVVRYRLDPASARRPTAYLRATAALNGADEQEAAVGISARPLAGLPLSAAAELRASRLAGRTSARPAAMLVTELAPFQLPLASQGEVYAQAGYVGGRSATAFVDGQLRVDREALRLGKTSLRAGAGAWGGAQKGAARLDVGPSANAYVAIGDNAGARVAIDWRFRVAGDAQPKSGPAITLSAGF